MANSDITEAFATLAETDYMMELAAVVAGFLGAGLAQSLLEGFLPWDLPNEAYGLGVAGGALYFDVPQSRAVAVGGGMNAVDAAAQRVGIQEQVENTL